MNRHNVKTIVEIFTELSFLDETLQIAVSGRYNPNINGHRHDSAHPLELPLLEKAQELRLKFRRHVADLVEKDRAAMSQFDLARLTPVRAGKRALFMAEQFALQEFFRQTHRIDSDKRPIFSFTPVVNGASEDLFAGSAFAEEQDRRTAAGCLLRQINGLLHLGALADNQTIAFFDFLRENLYTALEPLLLQRFRTTRVRWSGSKGLVDGIVSPFLHRLHRPLHRSIRRYHHHRSIVFPLAKFFEDFQPA